MSYDPEARRDTPLARKLKARIAADGPIPVAAYMRACLHDPEHGYYRGQPAIGRGGDFVTSPEISQVFGELIGLWAAVVWRQMGSPGHVALVELGPGRGTLMADALRAARLVPEFQQALTVHLVETNPSLVAMQRAALAASGVPIEWHGSLDGLLTGPRRVAGAPAIVLANEFLDTVPGHQHVLSDGHWRQRAVGLRADGELGLILLEDDAFGADEGPWSGAEDGDLVEHQLFGEVQAALATLGQQAPLAAVLMDYGHVATAPGDTLQAVRDHHHEHPLTSPGEADLSLQVDFEAFSAGLLEVGHAFDVPLAVDGPVTQAELLGALGIVERASRLMAANPVKAATVEAGVARLLAPNGMGTRFKALGVRSAGLPPLPGLTRAVDRVGRDP
jgi:SAM-dependent MidA family methyltransferase